MSNSIRLEIHKDGLMLGGEPFYLASGDMHYFRFFKDGWRRRLQLMKDFGLTAVQTYVPWNLHEPEEGCFRFEDNLDIAAFLELCAEVGLKVMLRPSVYMCSEWDFGGMPYWLIRKEGMVVRTSAPAFMECAERYYRRLAKEFVPFLSTNGGPIIAVAVENEYGSFGDDRDYIKSTGDLLKELGVDVPLYTTDGHTLHYLMNGNQPEYWAGVNVHQLTEEIIKTARNYQPDKPIYIGEFWAGRGMRWGEYFNRQKPYDVAAKYKYMLDAGAFVNFYMFCGGTNFGFQNGALLGDAYQPKYQPFATSYDVDAPVTEYGKPTEKYYACKKVLRDYMLAHGFAYGGSMNDIDSVQCKTQCIPDVQLIRSADLLYNLDNITEKKQCSAAPLTMEEMGQDYGFILYSTSIKYIDDLKRKLIIHGLKDRALVYGDGKYLGCYMRDRNNDPIIFNVPKQGMKLDILVENMGRVNFGNGILDEKKGISGFVKLDVIDKDGSVVPYVTFKTSWSNCSIPLKDLSNLDDSFEAKEDRPAFWFGEFDAAAGVDTFIDMNGWEKGVVWINDFNLGRYWSIGPQRTLYVPGELLQEHNTIKILELHKPQENRTVSFIEEPVLDTIEA